MTNLHLGDCIEVMATLPEASVDAIVTDPPYLLQFMGKTWDSPTKMSGHATPNADVVGFYQAVGTGGRHDGGMDNWKPNLMQQWHQRWAEAAYRVARPSAYLLAFGGTRTVHRMTCALEDAGWIIRDMLVWGYASGFPKSKASLKPAWEPIVMARKPGPLRALAIDECRIGTEVETWPATRRQYDVSGIQPGGGTNGHTDATGAAPAGRWPANIVLTDPIFDGGIEGVVGGGETTSGSRNGTYSGGGYRGDWPDVSAPIDGDTGTYSRFFLVPKSSRSDREPVLGPEWFDGNGRANTHPTCKPTALMRHLVRLVTPTGGIVLDPFLGSGTTALAAEMEGFDWIGIEREAEYVAIAEARLNGTQRGLGLEAS